MTKEQKFFKALQNIFIGAKIEGQGGFINLMRIKTSYYSQIERLLIDDVDKALEKHPKFREELFDKLHSFFNRYFTKSGSIYFNSTPFHNNVYEKVYTDEKDVILFWKTQMLYYVKTDRIFRSMPVEFEGFKFYFYANKIDNKKANEKRSLVFELNKIQENGTINFSVAYSERGRKTKTNEILKEIKKKGISIKEEELEKAFRVFGKQSEVDYFINKNARSFLQEQFKLWSYQYFWEGAKEWGADRVNQLQILKDIAFKIIDFISQFEDELVKIWNKPKFVKNSNYVITLDRIADKKLVEKIRKHKNYKEQNKEWKELGIKKENPKAPIDTKYFKDLELEILSQFEDLDKSLDGWLIKSENYQALNTILPKFREKVQTIYIDPPFNTGDDFDYIDKFQDSTWLSLIVDRMKLGLETINKKGSYYLHLDTNADYLARHVIDNLYFNKDNFKAEISWDTCGITGFKSSPNNWITNFNNILFFTKSVKDNYFNKLFTIINSKEVDEDVKEERKNKGLGWLDIYKDEKNNPYIEVWENGKFVNKKVKIENKLDPIGMIWKDTTEILSFLYTQVGNNESFFFNTGQKPEHLLRRIIQSTTDKRDIVLDYFLGIGTSIAVAQKLNRRWIGIDMGEHFNTFYSSDDKKKIGVLGRIKIVLSGDQTFNVFGNIRHPQLSRNINWRGGGFFKYYELEQYEDALANTKYTDGDLFSKTSDKAYQDYVFMKDEKMLKALEINYENNKVVVDLSKIYSNIDIAETLSNLTGKWIKSIRKNEVEFTDGSKINTKELDYKLIKSLIWWE